MKTGFQFTLDTAPLSGKLRQPLIKSFCQTQVFCCY